MHVRQGSELSPIHVAGGHDQEVDVAVGVTGAEGERPLEIGTEEVVREGVARAVHEVGEDGQQVVGCRGTQVDREPAPHRRVVDPRHRHRAGVIGSRTPFGA